MPNILQIQKEIENLSDQRLAQELNSPYLYTGPLDSVALAAEAQKRDQQRSANMNTQVPQNTVKDQLVQKLMSGIGSIPQNVPTGPMPNEMMAQMQAPMQPPMGMYAGGGIVGYQTGGEVDPDPEEPWYKQRPSVRQMVGGALTAGSILSALPIGRGIKFSPKIAELAVKYGPRLASGGAGVALMALPDREEPVEAISGSMQPLVIPDRYGIESPSGGSLLEDRILQAIEKRGQISPADQAYLDTLAAQRGAAAEDQAEMARLLNSMRASREDLARREQELIESERQQIQSYIDPEAEQREARATLAMVVANALSGRDIAGGLAGGIPELLDLGKEQRQARRQINEQVMLLNREKLKSAQNLQNFIDDIEIRVAEGSISQRQAEREVDMALANTRRDIANRENDLSNMIALYGAQTQRMVAETERPSIGERRQLLLNQLQLDKKDPVETTANSVRSEIQMYLDTGDDRDLNAISRVVDSALTRQFFPNDKKNQIMEMVFGTRGFADGGLYTGNIANMISQP